ncbi:1,2-phenylacetyl-CoA epoxidase subunit PaaD [Microvirga thermotolerans]|uniref:Phenylacetate-CoA oxygenase subunit PaaJ n=1 Tax=Microvirga thermotolerans TaxID=2651334 RepID=A0A5P9JSK9_9HYPH|nr:1,2-phenylacetyl-CoA epoxidase subunit PaaD [Microvirga thermotolerans]QFU15617.1 phenylacetate-CoA oxygenase subunit PaaJ [Microvirga thermotolerans]
MTTALTRPSLDQVRNWLGEVPDPEVPAVSVMDLGIVRDIRWMDDELVVAITPTYSGCPATSVIALDIEVALRARGIDRLKIERRLSPPWTTDWITEEGRRKLEAYGIAPPAEKARDPSPLDRFLRSAPPAIKCPRCSSENTFRVSEFGSTPCKAQYQCRDCLEPFDYFKCI